MTVTDPFVDIEDSFLDRFHAQITDGGDGGSSIPTVDPNADGDRPDSGLHAVLSFQSARDQFSTTSPNGARSRTSGIAFVELFGPLGEGKAAIRALAKRVRVAFGKQTIDGVVYRTPFLHNGSGDRVGGFWRVVVAVPFYADDFAA